MTACSVCFGNGSLSTGRPEPCGRCGGRSYLAGAATTCPSCGGSGASNKEQKAKCWNCNGTGDVDTSTMGSLIAKPREKFSLSNFVQDQIESQRIASTDTSSGRTKLAELRRRFEQKSTTPATTTSSDSVSAISPDTPINGQRKTVPRQAPQRNAEQRNDPQTEKLKRNARPSTDSRVRSKPGPGLTVLSALIAGAAGFVAYQLQGDSGITVPVVIGTFIAANIVLRVLSAILNNPLRVIFLIIAVVIIGNIFELEFAQEIVNYVQKTLSKLN